MATYLEIAGLRNDEDFRKRLAVAVIKYAAYVLGNTGDTNFRENKVRWAREALANPDGQVSRLMGFVLGDGTVQNELAEISDVDLQAVVEYNINVNMSVLAL
jgi:hypothetical protein